MAIYVIVEPSYEETTWCNKILQGILTESKQRKIDCYFQSVEFVPTSTDLIALVGNSPFWIQNTYNIIRSKYQAHLVIISSTPYDIAANSICTDLYQSMLEVLSYLHNDCKKDRIALYGINPASTTDLLKLRGFSRTTDVYYSNSDLRTCFLNFFKKIDSYDAVICANDYAALSLLHNLKQLAPSEVERLFLVSFSDLCITQKFRPAITSVALDYYEYGRKAVDLHRLLQNNEQISTAVIYIKSEIIPRDTTKYIPFQNIVQEPAVDCIDNSNFYADEEIKSLIMLENLFSVMNDTDEQILKYLLQGVPYEKMAYELHMSVNGIKYRINKLLEICKFRNRQELLAIYRKFGFQ